MPNPLRLDPTKTATLRRAFMRAVSRRVTELKRRIRQVVDIEDGFGLRSRSLVVSSATTANTRFVFESTPERLEAFRVWLQEQYDDLLLGNPDTPEDEWWYAYIQEGYRKGAVRAFEQVRGYERVFGRGGIALERDEFLATAFFEPVSVESLQLLASRVLSGIQGITDATTNDVMRELTDGFVQGLGPREIARNIASRVDSITLARANTLARTEVIRAHAEGSLIHLQQLGVDKVGVMVEWSTAGDNLVCPLCADLQGVVLTIKEARGLIPRHPNCRCAFIPANLGEDRPQVRGQQAIERRIRQSIMKELPAQVMLSYRERRRRSRWAGADVIIDPQRPVSPVESP